MSMSTPSFILKILKQGIVTNSFEIPSTVTQKNPYPNLYFSTINLNYGAAK